MKTPIEIAAMPLIERQQLVVDLRGVPAADKFYAVALQLISAATSKKDWKEPEQIEVKNIAGHDITVDKTKITKDGTAKIFPWQFLAVRRFVEPTDEDTANAAIKPLLRKPSADEGNYKPLTEEDVAKLIAKAFKEAGIKAATALLLFAFLLFGVGRAGAQTQSFMVGSVPSLYHTYSIAGLNGGTNAWSGSQSFTTPVVTSVTTTNPNWVVINGIATNEYTTSTQSITNAPGVISLANYDEAELFLGYNSLTSGGVTGGTATWDYSPDGTYWQLNALTMYCAASGTSLVGTNYFFPIGTAPGLLRFNTLTFAGGGIASNITVEVALKPYRTGP